MKQLTIHRSELAPGQMRRVTLSHDHTAILIANVDNEFFAVDDMCTHEDASLATGRLDGARVKCPLHGSRFCLRTGQPLEEPADEALRCYAVEVVDDLVIVNLPDL